ncbi:MAG: redoxin domain-containing protein [Gammaproteobacteria bacterium]|nr:redoxin domain-containing protein [Gammaproteobacteria bacterium]
MRSIGAQFAGGRHGWLVAVVLFAIVASVQAGSKLVGESAPDFALKSTAGKNLRLSEYRGELVLLTFWSAGCGRCIEQLPQLNRLQDHYADLPVRILSVNLDRKLKRVHEAETDLGLGFPVLLDQRKKVTRRYDPNRLPLTVILDPAGVVRYRHEGFKPGHMDLYFQQLDGLLAEQAGVLMKAGTQ